MAFVQTAEGNGEDLLEGFLMEAAHRAPGTYVRLTVRDLLVKWGASRRGYRITDRIKKDLSRHKLVSAPAFEDAWIDDEIELIPYATSTSGEPVPPSSPVENAALDNGTLRVRGLKSANTLLIAVSPQSSLAEAQSLMIVHDYSQLPILAGPRSLKGAVTWESIAKARLRDLDCDLVGALTSTPEPLRLDDDLLSNVPRIIERGFLFVKDENAAICGVITTADLSDEFLRLAQPFFLLGEIERRLRRTIDEVFDAVDLQSLQVPGSRGRPISSAEDLTLGQYGQLLGDPDGWRRLTWPTTDRKVFLKHLNDVREIRNDVMHFSPDPLTSEQKHLLSSFVQWLRFLDPRP